MLHRSYTFVVALCLCSAAVGQQISQIPLSVLNDSRKQIFTPEFSAYVDNVIQENKMPGLSLALVRTDGNLELGSWGNKTEDGEHVTADVSVAVKSPITCK
jgi:hypothetical protein